MKYGTLDRSINNINSLSAVLAMGHYWPINIKQQALSRVCCSLTFGGAASNRADLHNGVLVVVRGAAPLALYLQPVTLLESMVTEPRKAGYCILTPSLANIPALLFAFVEPAKQTGLTDPAGKDPSGFFFFLNPFNIWNFVLADL